MRFLVVALAAACLAIPGAPLAALAPAEQKMIATVDAEAARAEALLERLVGVNSGTHNPAGVEEVGRLIRGELEPLGFSVRWVPMTAVGRAGHLIAEHRPRARRAPGKRMLLIGHLDTVFEPSSPFQTFKRLEDGWAEGPGTSDMKGGLVVMIQALRAMREAGALQGAHITIVLTGDEEDVGEPQAAARADLIAAAKESDLALEFEEQVRREGRDWGSISRRSSSSWTLRVKAPSGHSSRIFSEAAGYGAAYELARILDAFREALPEPYLTYNIGLIGAGTTARLNEARTETEASGKTNVIAGEAVATGDIRTLDNAQLARTREKMRAIVAKHLPGASAEIVFDDGYPAMPPTEASRALLGALNRVGRDLGLPDMPELDPLQRGAGDIAFVAPYIPGLVGVGAVGQGSHAPGEKVDLKSLPLQAKRAAILMRRLSLEAPSAGTSAGRSPAPPAR